MNRNEVIEKTKDILLTAASTFREDQKDVYKRTIASETVPSAKWVLENILENAEVAEKNRSPLCDDTGIPHLFLEAGPSKNISGEMLEAIQEGVAVGLRQLPGRPMAVQGDDEARIDQSGGLSTDPGAMVPAPIMIKPCKEDTIRLHVLMQGGGPEIRGKTYRVFHKHSVQAVMDEVIGWAKEEVGNLGCTPCTAAIGIGRSHFEASSLMIQAMAYGNYNEQSHLEEKITRSINESNVGPLGLSGNTTALATFLRIGPQRASGVRVVCMRLGCCFEPRVASGIL